MMRLIAPALLLGLAACNQARQETSAGGEILEGSATDAMLPLDTVRSQAPLAPRAATTGKAEEGDEPSAVPTAASAVSEAPSAADAPSAPDGDAEE